MDDGLTPIERAQQAAKARTEASTATAAARKSNEAISNPTNVPSNGATAGGSGGTQGTTPATTDDNSGLGVDSASRRDLQKIPLLRTRAGPRDGKEEWTARLREEYAALIRYAKNNQENDLAWFKIAATDESGVHWGGKCWYYHESLKYEFDLDFEVPVSYPATNPEFRLPQLQGKTAKMYHGGKICLTEHFMPLWNRNVPRFGIAHALSLGLAPWLAAEIPDLVRKGLIEPSS